EVRPHLLDLVVDRTALRRLAVEQREKSGTVATHAPGLRRHAFEFALLPASGILIAPHLFVPGRVAAAAMVDGRQLRFEPWIDRIDRRALRWRRTSWRLRMNNETQRGAAEQDGAGNDPSEERGDQLFRHIRPLERTRAANRRRGQGELHIAASLGSVTSFPGRRCGRKSP